MLGLHSKDSGSSLSTQIFLWLLSWMCPREGEQVQKSVFKLISKVEKGIAVLPDGGKWLDIDSVHKFIDFEKRGL